MTGTPRQMKVPYLEFFAQLTEALRELFAEVPYDCILAPLTISNHGTIQKAFNTYRTKLPKREIRVPSTHAKHFDSLRASSGYHILSRKGAN